MRILKGKSPFYPDRTHIHHLLIDAGFTHLKATTVLIMVNISLIAIAISLQDLGSLVLLILILVLASIVTSVFFFMAAKKMKNDNKSFSA